MFLFKSKPKPKSKQNITKVNTEIKTETYIDEEFEEFKNSPRQTIVHMNCCDSKFSIDKLFNICLCPNCNTQFNFIIEKNIIENSENNENSENSDEDAEIQPLIKEENKYGKILEEIQTKIQNTSQKDIEIFSIVVIVGILSYFMYIPMYKQLYL